MKKSYSIVIVILLVLVLGTIIAGCLKYPSTSQAQSTGTTIAPTQASEQPSGGSPQAYPAVTPTNSYGGQSTPGQNYNPPQTQETQKTYAVMVTIERNSPIHIVCTYAGGPDASDVQSIWWYVNGINVGMMSGGNGQTVLPVGIYATYPATNPGYDHVVAIAHFTDGSTQVILDTAHVTPAPANQLGPTIPIGV
jgi:hypothetical protein